MIKKFAWDVFKNTGDINTYLELKQIQNIEQEIVDNKNNLQNGIIEGNNQKVDNNKWQM
ncbi:MAG: YqzL family protein [Clostridia bacterium]|nr:YqzL family protein [Clostridia bacterium]